MKTRRFPKWGIPILFLLAAGVCLAQDGQDQDQNNKDKQASDHVTAVPIFAGSIGFDGRNFGGVPQLLPYIAPVVLVPLGDHLLIEADGGLTGVYNRANGNTGDYGGFVDKTLGYLQLDYIANSHVTVTVGKFIMPFGVYSERTAEWFKPLQEDPLNVSIGNPVGYGNGAMLRGVAYSSPKVVWNYAAYYTVATNTLDFFSPGTVGFRTGFFLPEQGFEAGVSYQRVRQNFIVQKDTNPYGFYFSWQPNHTSLDIKSEYAHSSTGSGYWLQGALRLDQSPVLKGALKRFQVEARVQQTFSENHVNSLTGVDRNQGDVGLNYYLFENTKLFANYGRAFQSNGDRNVWNVGFAHHFVFPMWPGGK